MNKNKVKSIFDCFDEGCGTCEVCEYLNFIEFAQSTAPGGSSIEYNPKLEDYLKRREQRDKEIREEVITEDTSDGYHTFKELYEYRKLYNALLFNEWYAQGKYSVIKSKRHSDGEECFGGGWFIVMAETPAGQVSNHYELADWGLFNCPERPTGYEYDGHTPQDVAERLKALTNNTN